MNAQSSCVRWAMLPGNRCSAGGVRNTVSSRSGSIAAIVAASSPPIRRFSSSGPRERLLERDLLVEREADQQRERLVDEEAVGLVVAGERELLDVGHGPIIASDGC